MPRAGLVLLLAALGGAGTMTVELAAVRLLAPWFGTSQAVWTNVIGVILLALSLGYLTGARASRGRAPLTVLGVALLVAGALTAALPHLAGPVAGLLLPSELALDEAVRLVVWGSLAAALVLFLLPAWLLGMVAPLAVEAVQRLQHRGAGEAGGRVLFASTFGSLAGVFGTTHVLIPELGLARSFLLAAFVLAGAGAIAVVADRRASAAALLLLVPCGLLLGDARVAPTTPEGWVLLEAVESPYQSVRVREDQRGEVPMRHLQVNEAFDSFQSVWQPSLGLLPEGFYYNLFALPLHWSESARGSDAAGEARVLVLGLGAGTAWRVLEGAAPEARTLALEGVELDPAVIALARRHMELPEDDASHRTLAGLDARVALRVPRAPVDLMILDCYANQVEIPAHLATLEFFTEVRDALTADGWMAMNVGGFGLTDPLALELARTVAAAFGAPALLVRVPASRNLIVFASAHAGAVVEDGGLRLPPELARGVFAPLVLPGSAALIAAGDGPWLTDDHAPLEQLQLASLREARR